jgi:YQGE family putative transporter
MRLSQSILRIRSWVGRLPIRGLFSLPKDTLAYILNTSLQTSRDQIINLFMLVFIWKFTSDLVTVCQYRLAIALVIPVSAFAAGWLARRSDPVAVFRLGLLLYIPFLLILLLLGQKAAAWAMLIGLLVGLADGVFWTGRNTLDFEYGRGRDAARFLGLQSAATAAVGLAAPVFFGFLIERTPGIPLIGDNSGYFLLFLLAVLISLAGVALAVRPPREKRKRVRLDWRIYLPFTTSLKWSMMLLLGALSSFRYAVASILSVILFYHLVPSELALGGVQSAGTVLTIVLAFASGHFVTPKNRIVVHAIAMLCFSLSCGFLGFRITSLTVILFILLQRTADGLIRIPTATIRYDVIRSLPGHEDSKTDYAVASEPFLAVGRIAGILLMIGVIRHFADSGRGQFEGVKVWLAVLSVMPLAEWCVLWFINRRLKEQGHAGRHITAG